MSQLTLTKSDPVFVVKRGFVFIFCVSVLLSGLFTANAAAGDMVDNTIQPEGHVIVPDTFLRRWDPVTIFFEDSVGREGEPEDYPDNFVQLSPTHPGAYTWLADNILQFRPAEPWPPLGEYTWTVEDEKILLSTLVSAPVATSPAIGAVGLSAIESITLTFAAPVDPQALKEMLSIELRPLPGIDGSNAQWLNGDDFEIKVIERASRNEQASYVINLFNPIPTGTHAAVHLRLSLADQVDESFFQVAFSTAKAFEIEQLGCPSQFYPITSTGTIYPEQQAIQCQSNQRQVQVHFSARLNEVSPIAARNLVHITPNVDNVEYTAHGNVLTVSGDFKTSQLYQVNLQPIALKDVNDRDLNMTASSELFLFFPEQHSFLQWQVGDGVMERFGPHMLPLTGRGFERMDLRIHPIDPLDLSFWPFPESPVVVDEEQRPEAPGEAPTAYTNRNQYISAGQIARQVKALGAPSVSEIISIPLKQAGSAANFGLDLEPYLNQVVPSNAPGTYLVGMRNLDQSTQRSWVRVQVTDLSLSTIAEPEHVRFVVSSLKDGVGVSRATIEIYGKDGIILSEKTDSDGFYHWDIPRQMKESIRRIVVRKGDDVLVLNPSRAPAMYANNLWRDDGQTWLQWTQYVSGNYDRYGSNVCHIFTERPIYKPEDAVHIKGYLRNVKQGAFSIPELKNPRIVVNGPGGMEWIYNVELTDAGSYYHEFDEEKLPTGSYSASFIHDNGDCGRVSFSKEAYRLPTFELQLNGSQTSSLDAPFVVNLNASYYAGGQVVDRPVQWQVTQFPYSWTPEKRDGFFYSTDARFSRQGSFRSSPVGYESGVTDEFGAASLTIDPTIETTAQPRRYVVEATVTGADDQSVTNTYEAIALPAFVLGLKVPRYTQALSDITADVLVADANGDVIENQNVTLRVLQRQWHSHLQAGDFSHGVAKYVTEVVDEQIFETVIQTGTDISTLALPISKAGVYIVEIEAQDRMGRNQLVTVDMFAGGSEPVTWASQPTEVFDVSTDKQEYAPGDVAQLILESPFQEAMALAIVEQPNGESEYEWIKVRGGSAVYSVPIRKLDMPRLSVHFLLIRGRISEADLSNIDLGKPQTLTATAQLEVSTVENRIAVDLQYPEKVQPGEEITVDIKLSDHRGSALAGEVTLWLVDQSVLSLGAEQRIDPLPDFIRHRDSYMRLRDTRNAVLGYFPYQEQPGGGASRSEMMADELVDNVTVRKNFSPVPYFNPTISVGRNGKASVTFTMPDNLTNFKVRAKVVSAADKFGFYTGQISVRLPVIVQPSLPRFVRPGDEFTAIGIARVVEGESGPGRVQFVGEGLEVAGDNNQTYDWVIGTPQRIEYDVSVPTPSYNEGGTLSRTSVDITMAVERTDDNARDAFKLSLPIRADRKEITQRDLYTLTTDNLVLDGITEPVREGTFKRSLMVSTQPELLQMSAGLNYLMAYPHNNSENRISRARAQLASASFDALLNKTSDEPLRDKVITDTLQWLGDVQTSDGLISYWPGSDGYVSVSAWALLFLVEAEDAGYPVDAQLYRNLVRALTQAMRSDYRHLISGQEYADRSWALTALAQADELDSAYAAELARKAEFLNLESLSQVIAALSESEAYSEQQLEQLYQKMWSGIVLRLYQGNEVYGGLQNTASAGNKIILPSETRTIAEVLRAALAMPDSLSDTSRSDIDPALRRQVLIDAIVTLGNGDGWGSTNANASALLALADVLQQTSDTAPTVTVQIESGRGAQTIQLGEQVFAQHAVADLSELNIQLNTNAEVVLIDETRYLPAADGSQVAAHASGFVVNRELLLVQADGAPSKRTRLDEAGLEVTYAIGDVIEEHVEVINPSDQYHVAVVIPLAAGMEPLNPALATAPPEATADGQLTLQPAYAALLDDQVTYYYNLLPKGTYHFYFRTRATIPGRYIQPAAYSELMYDEAINGNSNGARIVVE